LKILNLLRKKNLIVDQRSEKLRAKLGRIRTYIVFFPIYFSLRIKEKVLNSLFKRYPKNDSEGIYFQNQNKGPYDFLILI